MERATSVALIIRRDVTAGAQRRPPNPTADKPHKDIHTFTGRLTHASASATAEPLSVDNTLWCNTVVASDTVVGAFPPALLGPRRRPPPPPLLEQDWWCTRAKTPGRS